MKKLFPYVVCSLSVLAIASAQTEETSARVEGEMHTTSLIDNSKTVVPQKQLTPKELKVAQKNRTIINNFIKENKDCKSFDTKNLTQIFTNAQKEGLSEQVLHQYVRDLVQACPDNAPKIVVAAAQGYGKCLTPAQLNALCRTAVVSHPTPYASIPALMAEIEQFQKTNPISLDINTLSVSLAQLAPDNPLTPVVVSADNTSSDNDPSTDTPRESVSVPQTGYSEMFSSRIPLSQPSQPQPVSPAGGQQGVQ